MTATPPPLRRRLHSLALVAAVLLAGCNVQQIMIGVLYRIVTPAAGGCPVLTWQFVVDAQRHIEGTLSRPEQPAFASLSGTLAPDDSFSLTVADPAARRTADVSGRFTSGISTLSIRGDGAGAGCNGQTFSLRLGGYFAHHGGGGGGGG